MVNPIRRLRSHGRDRFGPWPRSIHVPPAEMRRRVENWADFIEYLPTIRRDIHGPVGPVTDSHGTLIGWNGPPPPELAADFYPTPRDVVRRTIRSNPD